MTFQNAKLKNHNLSVMPSLPGVYYFFDATGKILYIGKATNLKTRVASYFQKPGNRLIEKMIHEVASIKIKITGSALEAFFLESNEIRQYQPKYNILAKDDKTKLGVFISNQKPKTQNKKFKNAQLVPTLELARENDIKQLKSKFFNFKSEKMGDFFGPFVSSGELKIALKLLRKLFPYCEKPFDGKPCFYSHIGLCPGVCNGKISVTEYKKTFRQIKLFLHGKVKELKKQIEIEMKRLAKAQKFEEAEICKKQLFALAHIQDIALTFSSDRIKITNNFVVEAFDISNLGGQFAVGSRVVFLDGHRAQEHYRKFQIRNLKAKIVEQENIGDLAMMEEMLVRRKKHTEWIKPNLIVIDGGKAHLNLAQKIFNPKCKTPGVLHFGQVKIVAIAKGARRNKNEFFGQKISKEIQRIAINARDEAHRFAIKYHRQLTRKNFV